MKRLVLIALLLISAIIWFGCDKEEQYGTITGVVTDAATGEPIDNANVKLNPRGETTLTGNDGSFQFNEMTEGKYSLSISKIGYVDLDDDYEINLMKGQTIRRDVQLREVLESFKICVDGQEVDFIDFGANTSYNQITIKIVNDGTEKIDCIELRHNTNWISFLTVFTNENSGYVNRFNIEPNNGATVTINLHRSNLIIGENTTYINVSSGSLTKSLEVRAQGLGMPVVSNPILYNISYNSCDAQATVTYDGGGPIVDKGFQVCGDQTPPYYSTLNYEQSCGPGIDNFQYQIPYGTNGHYAALRVRAYASNGVYKAYSGWVYVDD